MSHYDTLGVARDASTADIKAAWRRASAAAHPDREGGSTERMQAVNQAYEVLGDPDRRAAYDATGSDVQTQSVEDEARGLLVGMLGSILDDENLLQTAAGAVAQIRQGLQDRKSKQAALAAKLKGRLGKVRAKQGENLVDQLLTTRLEQLTAEAAVIERALLVNAEVSRLLDNFEQEPAEAKTLLSTLAASTQSAYASQASPYSFGATGSRGRWFWEKD